MKIFSSLTVNWHFIDLCNMKCRFCFANKSCKSALFNYKPVLEHCKIFKRVNFVGGEPTIAPQFSEMVDYAISIGLQTSVVTNGYHAMKENPKLFETFSKMVTVGLSIDSLSHEINVQIGRNVGNNTLSREDAIIFCRKIKSMGIELKINTVVNQYNLHEDFSEFLSIVQPDRWKIFQVMPIDQKTDEEFCITEQEFQSFVHRHKAFYDIMYVENNDMMADTYIMLDADARFMDTQHKVKVTQKSLFNPSVDVINELSKTSYDITKYHKRYEKFEG